MKHPLWRVLSVIIVIGYLAGCASTTSRQALGIHTASDGNGIRIQEQEIYVIKFTDGTETRAVGNALMFRDNSMYAYSSEDNAWRQYSISDIEDVYLEKTDHVKRKNRASLITGAAVLAAFAAAAAGGYFLERKLR